MAFFKKSKKIQSLRKFKKDLKKESKEELKKLIEKSKKKKIIAEIDEKEIKYGEINKEDELDILKDETKEMSLTL